MFETCACELSTNQSKAHIIRVSMCPHSGVFELFSTIFLETDSETLVHNPDRFESVFKQLTRNFHRESKLMNYQGCDISRKENNQLKRFGNKPKIDACSQRSTHKDTLWLGINMKMKMKTEMSRSYT